MEKEVILNLTEHIDVQEKKEVSPQQVDSGNPTLEEAHSLQDKEDAEEEQKFEETEIITHKKVALTRQYQ